MVEVLLVRHGQSEWNAQGRWQGQADPPLTEQGQNEADVAGQVLTTLAPFDAIVSSALKRAATTADIINRYLKMDPPLRIADLNERNVGPWSGLTTPEIEAKYPGCLEREEWPEGFELQPQVFDRSIRGFRAAIIATGAERLIAVCHGGLLYAIEAHYGHRFQHLPNLCGRWLSFSNLADAELSIELGDRISLRPGIEVSGKSLRM